MGNGKHYRCDVCCATMTAQYHVPNLLQPTQSQEHIYRTNLVAMETRVDEMQMLGEGGPRVNSSAPELQRGRKSPTTFYAD